MNYRIGWGGGGLGRIILSCIDFSPHLAYFNMNNIRKHLVKSDLKGITLMSLLCFDSASPYSQPEYLWHWSYHHACAVAACGRSHRVHCIIWTCEDHRTNKIQGGEICQPMYLYSHWIFLMLCISEVFVLLRLFIFLFITSHTNRETQKWSWVACKIFWQNGGMIKEFQSL